MRPVQNFCSSYGMPTLIREGKRVLHFICWSKPQNTLGRYAVQTARVLYVAQTVVSLVGFWRNLVLTKPYKNFEISLGAACVIYAAASVACLIPGVGPYLLKKIYVDGRNSQYVLPPLDED